MKERFIDRFEIVLLDMGRTFMFDVDRFSDADDFGATYRHVGGKILSDVGVSRIISALFERLLSYSRNPAYYDRFPSVLHCLQGLPEAKDLPEDELSLLQHVFALHEIGTVPDDYAKALCRLRESHRLAVLSDIWSKSDPYFDEFKRAGIRELFEVIVFSSDYGHIKPSRYLFAKALEALKVDPSRIVFVGDSLRRDIAGAKAVGLSAIWINAAGAEVNDGVAKPDLVIQDLRDLVDC